MNVATRRAFIGTTTALGLGSAFAVVGTAAEPGHDRHQVATGADDWTLAHIEEEAVRIARELHAAPQPELMLGLASNLRLFGKYSSARGLDAAMQDAMRTAVRTQGRDAVITRATAPETAARLRQTLTAAGILWHQKTIERRVYEQQLDVMLEQGSIANTLTTSAGVLEAAYADWRERRAVPGGRLVRAQNFDRIYRCAHLTQQCNYYDSQANYWCAMAYFMPPLGAVCAAHGLSAAGYCYAAYHYGC